MNQLDTPLGPDARAAKAGSAGKDQLKRALAGREERGTAFSDLLKDIGPKKTVKELLADKAGDATAAEDSKPGAETAEPASPVTQDPSASAAALAARLLLAPLQGSANAAAEPRKEATPRGPAGAAALSGALADMARLISRESGSLGIGQPMAAETGVAMPDQGEMPDLDLSRLSETIKDPALHERATPKEQPGLKSPAALHELAVPKVAAAPRDTAGSSDLAAAGKAPPKDAATDALALLTDSDPREDRSDGREDGEPSHKSPMTIAVVRQETHLPPVMRISPFQQIVEPIKQAVSELAATRSSEPVPDLDTAGSGEIKTPTKVLHLELKPVELGVITVKMRLSQNGMEMRIEASRAETATMLANDKEALREVIRASGHSADSVTVEIVHADAMPGDWQRTAHRQDNPQNDRSDAGTDGRSFNGSRQGEQGNEARRQNWTPDASPSKDEPYDKAESGRHSGGNAHLYL